MSDIHKISEDTPFFSVIIPIYNVERYIRQTLESLQQQTFRQFECLMIDDGSPDRSADICREFVNTDHRFRYFQKNNGGVSSARNFAMPYVRADYIAYLDGDDWWMPEYLEQMKKLIDAFPGCPFYSSARFLYIAPAITPKDNLIVGTALGQNCKIDMIRYAAPSGNLPVWTGSTIVNKEAQKKVGGFCERLKMFEDFDLWLKLAMLGKVAVLNDAFAYYRLNVPTKIKPRGDLPDIQIHFLSELHNFESAAAGNKDLKLFLDRFRLRHLLLYIDHPAFSATARQELAATATASWTFSYRLCYQIRSIRCLLNGYKKFRKFIKNILAAIDQKEKI